MRSRLLAVLLPASLLLFAPSFSLAQVERVPAIDRAVSELRAPDAPVTPPPVSKKPVPKVTAKDAAPPETTEPQNTVEFVKLLIVFIQLVGTAVKLGTFVSIAAASTAGTYLLMFLIKKTLQQAIPENYKKLLNVALGLLAIVAAVLTFFAGGGGAQGLLAGGAAGVGAAFAGPLHRIIDGIAGLKAR